MGRHQRAAELLTQRRTGISTGLSLSYDIMDIMEKLLGEGDYYDYGRVLSYHAPWMFVIGARGLGKTYGAKKLVIGDWIKNGGSSSIYAGRRRNRKTRARGLRTSRSDTRNWSSACREIRPNVTGWMIGTPPRTSTARHAQHGISWAILLPSVRPDKSNQLHTPRCER